MRIGFVPHLVWVGLAASVCHGQGIITTYAGTATCCKDVDGQQATATWLASASGITLDKQGNLYIWQGGASKIRKVSTAGVISTVAGNGNPGYTGDGGLAINASLFADLNTAGVVLDAAGNLYFADGNNHVVRKVDTAGIITTIAGNGTPGFAGDGGQGTKAQLYYPEGLALDTAGNLYIADSSNNRVRKLTPGGIISTYAGNGNVVYSGDNVQASTTAVDRPNTLTLDAAGNLYIAEGSESRVRKVNPSGIITTVAGATKKTNGFSGDGGQATAALLSGPFGLAVDSSGNLYISDSGNSRIRKVDAAGIITTYAGITGTASTPIGDGGPATNAFLGACKDLVLDSAGNLYIAGSAGGVVRVRKVAPGAGLISTPGALTFNYTIGGAAPASQAVSITSTGGAANFTASASGGSWLSVSPASGSTTGTLTVSVDPSKMPGGTYQGAITVTPTGSGLAPLSFQVTLNIAGAGAPVLTAGGIVNALGYQTKLAPDTVFVIFGSGMGPAALVAGSPNYQTSLGGTSITFTPVSGGAAIDAKIVYTVASQVAGLLPSSIAPGTYAVRLTYNTLTSAPQNVTVVARSFGIATSNSAGTGTAQATIGNVNSGLSLTRFTTGSLQYNGYTWTLTPAHPGDTLVLWGTGGGADTANDTGGTSGDQTAAGNFVVNVAGRPLTPIYAGASSGYPGLWQVNFVLPLDIATGCFQSLQVSNGAEAGNQVTIPIAVAGQSACTDPQLSQAGLAALDAGGTVKIGGLSVSRLTNTFYSSATAGGAITSVAASQEQVSGGIGKYSAAAYAALMGVPKIDLCTVTDTTAANGKSSGGPDGYLDLGNTLPVSGGAIPGGSVLSKITGPIYDIVLSNGTVQNSAKYTISGNGGPDAGAFSGSVNFPASFTVTNWASLSTIDRSKPLTINWSGGTEQIYIILSSSRVVGKDASNANIIHNVALNCTVPAAAGTYSIPVAALASLLPETIDNPSLATGSGQLAVETVTTSILTIPLTAGGKVDFASFTGVDAVSKDVTIQ